LSSGDLNTLLYGALIIVFLLFEPGGFVGLISRLQRRSRTLTHAKEEGGDQAEITDLSLKGDGQG
jgi:branched-chain amino acid transport system permease protein